MTNLFDSDGLPCYPFDTVQYNFYKHYYEQEIIRYNGVDPETNLVRYEKVRRDLVQDYCKQHGMPAGLHESYIKEVFLPELCMFAMRYMNRFPDRDEP